MATTMVRRPGTLGVAVAALAASALVVLAAIPFLLKYKIDRSHHAAVLESLAARNADHNAAPNLTRDLAQR